MTTPVTPLEQATDAACHGDKAANLARALGAGLPVPPGFVLGVEVLDAHLIGRLAVAPPSERGLLQQAVALAASLLLAPLAASAAALRAMRGLPASWVRRSFGIREGSTSSVVLRMLPPSSEAWGWSSRVLQIYGSILDVLQGQRVWLGVRPRRAGEWYALHPEWRSMIEGAPIGAFVMPAWADEGHAMVEAEAAADLLLVSHRSRWSRLRAWVRATRHSRAKGTTVPALRAA